MKVKAFHKLTTSTDIKVIGRIYFQFNSTQIGGFVDPENTTPARRAAYQDPFGEIDQTLDLHKFQTNPRAKMTDLMSSDFFWHRCFYSPRFAELFGRFMGEKCRLLPCTVHHAGTAYDYFLMELLPSMEIIDFEASEFGIYHQIKSHYLGPVDAAINVDSFWDVFRRVRELNSVHDIKARTIALKRPVDLVHLDVDNGYYVSDRLKTAIEAEELTGFEFEPIRSELEFRGDW